MRFVTTVYRVELGIGVGWCSEEFALMGQRFDRRGKRTDEMLELTKELWKPGRPSRRLDR